MGVWYVLGGVGVVCSVEEVGLEVFPSSDVSKV